MTQAIRAVWAKRPWCAAGRCRQGAAAPTSSITPHPPAEHPGWQRCAPSPTRLRRGGPRRAPVPLRTLCDPAARMDTALKRSRSEEPVELPPPAREAEEKEEEEERMEQGLEEEEEVDPRIQVGRV